MSTDIRTALTTLLRHLPIEVGGHNPARRVVTAVTAGLDIGLTPTKKLIATVTEFDRLRERADEHKATLTATPALDLDDDDYPQKLRDHLVSQQLADEAHRVTAGLLGQAAIRAITTIRGELPTLFDQLDRTYQDRYPDLLGLGDTRAPAAVLAARHDFAGQLARAHQAFMAVDQRHHSVDLDYRTDLWLHHTWTAEQWQHAIDSTGPAMTINRDPDLWHLAHRCGATPRLARSLAHAVADFHALDDANEQRDILAAHNKTASAQGAKGIVESVKQYIH
ncbi:hypothetical protein ACRAJ3_19620 [Rhodococcus pyridinivorans]|uniref:hypothetical protein n=1 Tax=Rhodococcus pyridinivorans TaxID=103816 RepID=UPI003D7FEB94